jgi:hypothetical protein
MERRHAVLLIVNGTLLFAGCNLVRDGDTGVSPTQPTAPVSGSVSLLTAVRNAGYSAESRAYGSNGAARIAINGDINWNFFVNDQLVGIGSSGQPTLNVPALTVPSNARLRVSRA